VSITLAKTGAGALLFFFFFGMEQKHASNYIGWGDFMFSKR
jgi:hypothetical protein